MQMVVEALQQALAPLRAASPLAGELGGVNPGYESGGHCSPDFFTSSRLVTTLTMTMNAVIYAMGTKGDVHPFIYLAKILEKDSWNILFLSNEKFKQDIEHNEIDFRSVTDLEVYRSTFLNKKMWGKMSGKMHAVSYHAPAVEPAFNIIEQLANKKEVDLIIGTGRLNGAEWAAEKYSIPYIKVNLSPSTEDIIVKMEYLLNTNGMLRLIKKIYASFVFYSRDLHFYLSFVRKYVNPVRARKGLKKWGISSSTWNSHKNVVSLYPKWFVGCRPKDYYFLDFPCFDIVCMKARNEFFQKIKSLRQKPIVFTLGSGFYRADKQIKQASLTCRILQLPGVFVGNVESCKNIEQYDNLLFVDYIDFEYLFGFAVLVCHHGGIGTLAQCVKAGVPQIVRPMLFDQFDNAKRIECMGVGLEMDAFSYSPKRLANKIKRLIESEKVRSNVEFYSRQARQTTSSSSWVEVFNKLFLSQKYSLLNHCNSGGV